MNGDLSILKMASAMARHAAARHRTIAENVAHADTPGYKAKDLPSFADQLDKLSENGGAQRMRPEILRNLDSDPNGNTVKLEDQMVRAVDAQAQHEAALAVYRKTLEILRLSVSTRR